MPHRPALLVLALTAGLALPTTWATVPAAAAAKTTPLALLNQLTVAPEAKSTAPSAFAVWAKSSARKCKNVRAQVLAVDAQGSTPKNCSPAGLTWADPFTGSKIRTASAMTVERMVPLEEAWDSGASTWDAQTRTSFANDLAYDGSLVAVSKRGAAKRKDREPTKWTPISSLRCDYVTKWISVKWRWRLNVDPAEYHALRAAMGTYNCTARKIPVVKRATVTLPPVPAPLDARQETCAELATSGLGPYVRGRDAEYAWYRDDDGDGTACEAQEAVGLSPSADWRTGRYTASLTPYILGQAVPVPGPGANANYPRAYLHVRLLSAGTEIWRGVDSSPTSHVTTRQVYVPNGYLVGDGTYTVQVWSAYNDYSYGEPVNPSSMTFAVDTTAPLPPSVTQGSGTATAVSSAADLASFRFSGWEGGVDVKARPGVPVSWTAPYVSGPTPPISVRARDWAGNVSAPAS